METKTINDLNKNYCLELEKIISKIKKRKCKLVLLQFPDGLKPYATTIVDYLEEKTNAEFLIWMGSCFGACDIPVGLKNLRKKIDLLVQFGHNSMMPNF
ncbi:diphthamide synthesis protein [Candidatus Pacearchaeota archaeon]|nr:diphthamide synthesis protein [Candidatus Pacearchaeota archaeon]